MKFFVDTADVDAIRDLADTGLVDGVTTNPSLIAKSGRDFVEVVQEDLDSAYNQSKQRIWLEQNVHHELNKQPHQAHFQLNGFHHGLG